MHLKSILNRVQKHPSFVYETMRLVERPRLTLEVRVRPRAGTRATCSQCRRRAPGYDTQAVRRFDFVPLWHIPVVFLYAMRRVDCPRCGVRVEALPWATGKHRLTDAYAWFLAGWAKRLSWREVAAAFPTSWDTVYRAVRMAVDWGLAHRDLTNIEAIGVDELSRRRGQRYLTLVYQIDGHRKRLLWIGRERKAATLEGFFDWFGPARSAALYFVCSDMWKPYLKVVAERARLAVQVLDRFHIMSHFPVAIYEVRAAEVRKLAAEGRAPLLKRSRWLLLKRPEKLTDEQRDGLAQLVRRNVRTVRAYLPKEDFQALWSYVSPCWAGWFLDRWCTRAMRSRLKPMKEVAPHAALAPRADPELVPSSGAILQWRCRRLQREGQSDHQTGVRLSHLRGTGSRFVPCTWRPARTRTHPQILLTRPTVFGTSPPSRSAALPHSSISRRLDRLPPVQASCRRGRVVLIEPAIKSLVAPLTVIRESPNILLALST